MKNLACQCPGQVPTPDSYSKECLGEHLGVCWLSGDVPHPHLCGGCMSLFRGSVVSDSVQPHGLYSPPGFFVHRILQPRIPEWVATFSSRGIFPTQGLNSCLLQLLHWPVSSLPLSPSPGGSCEGRDLEFPGNQIIRTPEAYGKRVEMLKMWERKS